MYNLLLVNVYKYSGSELKSGGQSAYKTAMSSVHTLLLLQWDLFTQQTSLIGKIIFQLLQIFVCVCVCVVHYSIKFSLLNN